jgi:predicted metal-dependent HD superfamily phosphohydrolase
MSKINSQILSEATSYVCDLLKTKLPEDIIFHTSDHAKYVSEKAKLIGKKCGLSDDELIMVEFCAMFHDVGFIVDPDNHEQEGVKIAKEFLIKHKIDKGIIEKVEECIFSTKMPQNPKDLLSKVLCDADLYHLSEDNYFEHIDSLRREWSNLSCVKLGKKKFYSLSVMFFKKHNYFTDYAKQELKPKKDKNLQELQKKVYMLEQKKEKSILENAKKKSKPKGYSRGVESMFRLTARNQISLSSIADNKSNILITVNSLILSILLTVLVSRFEETPNIILPTLIFILFALTTIIFAILSTRPNISSGKFNKEDIKQNKVNLLFFGNFYNMDLSDYEWAIEELMKNDENLYSTMIKDQYSLGKVLAKKYKLLRIAYNVFMFGIIISIISFILAFINI